MAGYAFAISQMQKHAGTPPAYGKVQAMGRQKHYQKSILVRLSNDEFRQLTERSKRSSVSLSRLLVESALANEVLTNEQREEAAVVLYLRDWAIFEVARVGNNLNQIARQLNSQRGAVSTKRIEEVLSATYEALCDLREYWSMGGGKPAK